MLCVDSMRRPRDSPAIAGQLTIHYGPLIRSMQPLDGRSWGVSRNA